MTHYPPSVVNLIKQLSRLPGIGEKTAERLTMHILQESSHDVTQLAQSILDVKNKLRLCRQCFALSDTELCWICNNPNRDVSMLCVVEQPIDMASIEKSGSFNGYYHILGGVLAPMEGIGPEQIRVEEIIRRIKRDSEIKEVILATGTNVEGESTASYIAKLLERYPVKVTRIASGVPIGGDLKYIDRVTLKRALEKRHDFYSDD
jgi:recombination protein RecR